MNSSRVSRDSKGENPEGRVSTVDIRDTVEDKEALFSGACQVTRFLVKKRQFHGRFLLI